MDYWYLISGFSWFISALAFYKVHKLWHKDVTEKENSNKSWEFQTLDWDYNANNYRN
jgi:hypothetical protein